MKVIRNSKESLHRATLGQRLINLLNKRFKAAVISTVSCSPVLVVVVLFNDGHVLHLSSETVAVRRRMNMTVI